MTRFLAWLLLPNVAAATDLKTGFKEASAGEIRRLETTAGKWIVDVGQAAVAPKKQAIRRQPNVASVWKQS